MRKPIIALTILMLAGSAPAVARGGGMHSGMHSGGIYGEPGSAALTTPANPAVPPSLTPDTRVVGSAPIPAERQPTKASVSSHEGVVQKPDPEDAAVNRMIRNICRGC